MSSFKDIIHIDRSVGFSPWIIHIVGKKTGTAMKVPYVLKFCWELSIQFIRFSSTYIASWNVGIWRRISHMRLHVRYLHRIHMSSCLVKYSNINKNPYTFYTFETILSKCQEMYTKYTIFVAGLWTQTRMSRVYHPMSVESIQFYDCFFRSTLVEISILFKTFFLVFLCKCQIVSSLIIRHS